MGNRIEPFVNSGSCSLPLSDFILCFFVSISSLFFPFLRPKEFRGICLSLASSYESFSLALFCAANRKYMNAIGAFGNSLRLSWKNQYGLFGFMLLGVGQNLKWGQGIIK